MRRGVWSVLAMLVAAGLGASVAWLPNATDRQLTLLQSVLAVLAAGGPILGWLWRRNHRGARRPGPEAQRAADELAAAVLAQWSRAATERGLWAPVPIRVHWRWSDRPVTGPVDAAATEGDLVRFPPLPAVPPVRAADLAHGDLHDLFRVYAGLGSGRLLLLGRPGAGKSAAVVLLLIDALEHRQRLPEQERARVPVPVLLTVSGWDPRRQPVADWLAARLAADHDVLGGLEPARRLVTGGHVALFLDGLDELPPDLRPVALRALDVQTTFRLVVTTRSRELVEAVAAARHLSGAAALELEPLTGADIAAYVTRSRTQPLPPGWQRLVDEVRDRPESPVAQALRSPLMLSLFRDTVTTDDDAAELLDSYHSREAVEDALLDRVLPAAYAVQPGVPEPRYTAAQAARWLGHLAHLMNLAGSRDLVWWHLASFTSWDLYAVTTVLVTGLGAGLSAGLLAGPAFGVLAGLAFGLVLTFTAKLSRDVLIGRRPLRLRRIRWSRVVSRQRMESVLGAGLTGALFLGFFGLLVAACADVTGIGSGRAFPVFLAFTAAGFLGCLSLGLYLAMAGSAGEDDPVSSRLSWRRDLWSAVGGGLWLGSVLGVLGGLVGRLAGSAEGGIACGIVGGFLLGVTSSQTWRALLVMVELRRTGVAPLRLLRFLDDAHRRSVLRTVGPVYQFRHARLQDRLATTAGATVDRSDPVAIRQAGRPDMAGDDDISG
ncbi:hypothetical protein [Micromonospora aurantiaca (nom. illeg.)]|uniref:hypothetical protein n=1 Tax=Micromonospora aurantiaca (nom. illeg.) TaxID=47850 RepID=UPI000B863325|nr:hypothetical protein [Micromonospora aurantiaca]